ncbi:MAG: hypothetical protein DI539_08085 [Flavobacterium psychrophilum]|nr:MAG: hypothetical protein DI539_08085 [Flavobacterium psychrophilum]
MKTILKSMPALLAILLLTGCNSDDDNNSQHSIVGSWRLTGIHEYSLDTFIPVEECYFERTTFEANGNALTLTEDCDDLPSAYYFMWEKAEGNTYNFIHEGDMIIPEEVNFQGSDKIIITFGDDSAKEYQKILFE